MKAQLVGRLLLSGLLAGPGWAQSAPAENLLYLANESRLPRSEGAAVSVPFPAGLRRGLGDLVVAGRPTAWLVLSRWRDGSIRVAQAQFPPKTGSFLGPLEALNLPLAAGEALAGPFRPHPWVEAARPVVRFRTEVTDPRGGRYGWEPAGPGEVLAETPLRRTVRHRGHHLPRPESPGAGRDYLAMTALVTEDALAPIITVDLILSNDYPEEGQGPPPLGTVGIRFLDLVCRGAEPLSYLPRRHQTGDAFAEPGGGTRMPLLRDSWLGDGQARRWRVLLLCDDPEAPVLERGLARRTWQAMALEPLRGLSDGPGWQRSRALSLWGGPAPPPPEWEGLLRRETARWALADHFGPFGSFGDAKGGGEEGGAEEPAPSPWVHAVQTSRGRLLEMLEGMAWQQACRPLHLQLPAGGLPGLLDGVHGLADREGSPRRALRENDPWAPWRAGRPPAEAAPHGWRAGLRRAWGVAILAAAWSATGDPWCREELHHLGRCLLALPAGAVPPDRLVPALLEVGLATGEPGFFAEADRRSQLLAAEAAATPGCLLALQAAWLNGGNRPALDLAAAALPALAAAGPLPAGWALPLWLLAREEALPEGARTQAAALLDRLPPMRAGDAWAPATSLITEREK